MTRKQIHSKFPGTCVECKQRFPAGAEVYWASGAGSICRACWDAGVVPAGPAGPELPATDGTAGSLSTYVAAIQERARTNEFARRYGPVGRFNRRVAGR